MRSSTVALLMLSALSLAGCSGGDAGSAPSSSGPSAGSSSGPSSGPSSSGPSSDPSAPAPGTTACDEVVAGIDAFNVGDFDGTVAHFEDAVPLAEQEAAAQPSQRADDLLEAVRYYAALPAEEYLEASATSPQFARYKEITLGQCASDGQLQEGPAEDDGLSA